MPYHFRVKKSGSSSSNTQDDSNQIIFIDIPTTKTSAILKNKDTTINNKDDKYNKRKIQLQQKKSKISYCYKTMFILWFLYFVYSIYIVTQIEGDITSFTSSIHRLEKELFFNLHSSSDIDNNNNMNEKDNTKEPIIKILKNAGVNVSELDDNIMNALPTWKQVKDLYGPKPIIYGLETCKKFQLSPSTNNSTEPELLFSDVIIGPAGMFNTGTNFIASLLFDNCYLPERQKKYGRHSKGIRLQVPWGKHHPPRDLEFRRSIRAAGSKNNGVSNIKNVLPIVLIRDPYRWMQSMCRSPYEAHWERDKVFKHCPNLLPPDKYNISTNNINNIINKKSPPRRFYIKKELENKKHNHLDTNTTSVSIRYNGFTRTHESLVHLWNDWYDEYIHAMDMPARLIIRYEDLVFHTEKVISTICKCAGGKTYSGSTTATKTDNKTNTTFIDDDNDYRDNDDDYRDNDDDDDDDDDDEEENEYIDSNEDNEQQEQEQQFIYKIDAAKNHGKNVSGFIDAIIRYGTENNRYHGYFHEDLKFIKQNLNESLMKLFGYKYYDNDNTTFGTEIINNDIIDTTISTSLTDNNNDDENEEERFFNVKALYEKYDETKNILKLLQENANIEKIKDTTYLELPTWGQITKLYGTKPKILSNFNNKNKFYDNNSCDVFRNTITNNHKSQRLIAPAGIFHSGVPMLSKLLQHNCYIPERYNEKIKETIVNNQKQQETDDEYDSDKKVLDNNGQLTFFHKNDYRGILNQVPWGRNNLINTTKTFRFDHKAPNLGIDAESINVSNVLPIIIIRDPYYWMQDMCWESYSVIWQREKAMKDLMLKYRQNKDVDMNMIRKKNKQDYHCPNLVQNGKTPVPVVFKYLKNKKRYDSMVHLWNGWYREYLDIDTPRVIIRYEDLIFHTKEVLTTVCECGGGKVVNDPDEIDVYDTITKMLSNDNHYDKNDNNNTTYATIDEELIDEYIDDMIRYSGGDGNVDSNSINNNRYNGYKAQDLLYAKQHLDPILMTYFGYQH